MTMTKCHGIAAECCVVLLLVGCATRTPSGGDAAPPQPSIVGQGGALFLIDDEPAGALDVIAARQSVADGEDVRVVGRIGGSEQPWIDGLAAFTIVDCSLPACSDTPGDDCRTPWDYCCQTAELKTATALVKLVDEQGQPVRTDARALLGVRELSRVIVLGQAQRDEAGNLTILASLIHIPK